LSVSLHAFSGLATANITARIMHGALVHGFAAETVILAFFLDKQPCLTSSPDKLYHIIHHLRTSCLCCQHSTLLQAWD